MVSRSQISIAALLSLVACVGFSTAFAADVGKNLAGESCQSAGRLTADQPTAISCGGAPVGQISYVPAPRDQAAAAALAQYVESQNQDIDCGETQWTGASALRICTLKSNGWPRIVIGASAGGKLYRAEGAPSSLPALQAAIAQDSQSATASGDAGAALAVLNAKFPASVLHAPASDYAGYEKSIEAARLAGAADNYAQAETNYRAALGVEERLFGPSSMIVGQTLADLALQVSNQSRFDEAAYLFRRASPIIEGAADMSARARLDSYLALDSANQRHYVDALNFAKQATAARRAEIAAATQANAQSNDAATAVPVSQGELAHALRIEAEMSLRLDDLAGAKAAAEEALWIVTDEPGLPLWWRADTIALVGEINERSGRVVAAEHDLTDARDLNEKLFGATAPTALADLKLGAFYARQQVYPASLTAFHAAFAIATNDPVARREIAADDIVDFATAELAAGDAASRDSEIFVLANSWEQASPIRPSPEWQRAKPQATALCRISSRKNRPRNETAISRVCSWQPNMPSLTRNAARNSSSRWRPMRNWHQPMPTVSWSRYARASRNMQLSLIPARPTLRRRSRSSPRAKRSCPLCSGRHRVMRLSCVREGSKPCRSPSAQMRSWRMYRTCAVLLCQRWADCRNSI